jgi:hypothetical protein
LAAAYRPPTRGAGVRLKLTTYANLNRLNKLGVAFINAFPAERWVHLRMPNPIESTFATVRHRTTRTKNCISRSTFLGLAFKLAAEAAKSWRRICAPQKVVALLARTRYAEGLPVPDDPLEEQRDAA